MRSHARFLHMEVPPAWCMGGAEAWVVGCARAKQDHDLSAWLRLCARRIPPLLFSRASSPSRSEP